MSDEAREAEAWLAELVVSMPISTEAALIAFKHGRAAGIRQAREAVNPALQALVSDRRVRPDGLLNQVEHDLLAAIDALGD
jgi:hypothetical protein